MTKLSTSEYLPMFTRRRKSRETWRFMVLTWQGMSCDKMQGISLVKFLRKREAGAEMLKPVQLLRKRLRSLRTCTHAKRASILLKNATVEIGRRKVNVRVYARKILRLRRFSIFTYVNVRRQKRDSGNPPIAAQFALFF